MHFGDCRLRLLGFKCCLNVWFDLGQMPVEEAKFLETCKFGNVFGVVLRPVLEPNMSIPLGSTDDDGCVIDKLTRMEF
jgi:hypothetical protein